MKKTVLSGLLAVSILAINTTPVFAEEVTGQNTRTDTQLTVIDNRDPSVDAELKLEKVPSNYNFETKLQSNQEYVISGGQVDGESNEFVVFSNSSSQAWSVKSTVDPKMVDTTKGKTVDVTGFTLKTNGNNDVRAGVVVMDSTTNKIGADGRAKVAVDSLEVHVTPENPAKPIEVGDVYTGTVQNVLYNTVNAE